MRQQSWLTDAYQASRVRKPLPFAPGQAGPIAGGFLTGMGGGTPQPMGGSGARTLPPPPSAPTGTTAAPVTPPTTTAPPTAPAPPTSTSPPPSTSTPGPAPRTGSAVNPNIPPFIPPEGSLNYVGPGAATGGTGTKAKANPILVGQNWLQYVLSDPYNRMVSDAAEKQTLENTNTAFDSARARMQADALASGAGESGVARGATSGLELARGQTQAKNVRDFLQYKTDLGDRRLQSLFLPYYSAVNNRPTNTQPDSSQQYLQYAALIASLFA